MFYGRLLLLSSDLYLYLYISVSIAMSIAVPMSLSIYVYIYLHRENATALLQMLWCLTQHLEHCKLSDPCVFGSKRVFI